MTCFEEAVRELTGKECPAMTGPAWIDDLQRHLGRVGYRAIFIQLDKRVIVSRRLTNGKVHAEVMHPTLITLLEKL